ncbi:MAG: glycosyltransferase, partial [Bacteroidota bacterium]
CVERVGEVAREGVRVARLEVGIGDAETGLLVPLDGSADSDFEPRDPDAFARDLAAALNTLLADPDRAAAMGRAGRQRVLDRFSWKAIAEETLRFYASLL